jgi:hypothetical protein
MWKIVEGMRRDSHCNLIGHGENLKLCKFWNGRASNLISCLLFDQGSVIIDIAVLADGKIFHV